MTTGDPAAGADGVRGRDDAPPVFGETIDEQTRCVHHGGPLDVVAIRFHCCREFYPCFRCHADAVEHAPSVWPRSDFDARALLCGVCRTTLTITEYRSTDGCPACGAEFNPGCALHHDLYFE